MIADIAAGPQAVDVRSFGVRCPPIPDSGLYGHPRHEACTQSGASVAVAAVAPPETRYILLPNQHIGAWKVEFMAE